MGLKKYFKKNNKSLVNNLLDNDIIEASVIGLIIGDALGVPVEFKSRASLENNPINGMEEYGTHNQPKGTWSDDSSMVIATIEAMKLNYDTNIELCRAIMNEFCEWKDNSKYTPFNQVFDIGNSTSYALTNYESKLFKLNNNLDDNYELKELIECGLDDIHSNGNGSLMRILPIALYGYFNIKDEEEFKNFIFTASALTHKHNYSKISCLIYAKYICFILDGLDKKEAYIKLKKWFKKANLIISDNKLEDSNIFDRIMKSDISKIKRRNIKSSGYVIDTLEAVFWSIMTTDNYKDAVLKAVNLGDDTDTIGALTGALAGLIYGFDSIPSEWLDVLQKKEYLIDLAADFQLNLLSKAPIEYQIELNDEKTLKESYNKNRIDKIAKKVVDKIIRMSKNEKSSLISLVKKEDWKYLNDIQTEVTTRLKNRNIELVYDENSNNKNLYELKFSKRNISDICNGDNIDSIIFEINIGDKIYRLSFDLKNEKSNLCFLDNTEKLNIYYSIFDKNKFDEFNKKLEEIIKKWHNDSFMVSELSAKWFLIEKNNNQISKKYVGINKYPDNWNEFIEFIKDYEIICKDNNINR